MKEEFPEGEESLHEKHRDMMRDRIRGTHKPKLAKRLKSQKPPCKRHLVIGDSHSHPSESNVHFEWAGRAAADGYDSVIDIGDSADVPSLRGWDIGSPGPAFEGRRFWKDVECYISAKERFMEAFVQSKGSTSKTRFVKTIGNHEFRAERVAESDPRLQGTIGVASFEDKLLGWETHPYLTPVIIDGIHYVHAFPNLNNGRPVESSVNLARSTITKSPGSYCRVFGHSHRFEWYDEHDTAQHDYAYRKITAINCGCFFPQGGTAHEWAGASVNRWRSGLLTLEVFDKQIVNFSWMDFTEVRRRFG